MPHLRKPPWLNTSRQVLLPSAQGVASERQPTSWREPSGERGRCTAWTVVHPGETTEKHHDLLGLKSQAWRFHGYGRGYSPQILHIYIYIRGFIVCFIWCSTSHDFWILEFALMEVSWPTKMVNQSAMQTSTYVDECWSRVRRHTAGYHLELLNHSLAR